MKYYKNLIKNKKFGTILAMIIITTFSILDFYFSFIDAIIVGLKSSNLSSVEILNHGAIGLIGSTNIGMALIGLFGIYIGLIFIPLNSPGSQDDDDYIVKSQNNKIYIKFKKNEFLLNKETFKPTDLFFRDKNGKFISMAKGYQIYNYVKSHYNNLIEKQIDNENIIQISDIPKNFNGINIMTNDEKLVYINSKKLKNYIRIFPFILSIFFFISFLFWLLGCFVVPQNIITGIILVLICFSFSKFFYKRSVRDKKLIEKIMNNNVYIADCYSYDKKIETYNSGIHYYIKICNNNYYINKWFEISKEAYKENETIKVKLVFFENPSIEDLDIIIY